MIMFAKFIIYCILSYGLANTIIYANGPFHMFVYIHKWAGKIHPHLEEVLSCFICLPYWIGFAFSAFDSLLVENVSFTPMNMIFGDVVPWYAVMFLDGICTSGAVWLINTIQAKWEKECGDGE